MQTAETIEKAWEFYVQEKFQDVLNLARAPHEDQSLSEMRRLALLELGKADQEKPAAGKEGLFGELYRAMSSYHQRNFENASKSLGGWILNRGYYSNWLLDRFMESCRRSSQFDLLFRVSSRLIQTNRNPRVAEAIFLSLYHLGRHEEALKIFDTYREHFADGPLLQYAGECLMKLQRYAEAERFFLAVVKKITGKDYQDRYEEIRDSYMKSLPELMRLEKKKGLSNEEWMDIGMGYLFSGDYARALDIFQKLKKTKQKAA